MELIYPINFEGHDAWLRSGYSRELANGEVITKDGEVLGIWRVVDYDPNADASGGRYEFVEYGQDTVLIAEHFAFLDYRVSRGLALSNITNSIREWHDTQST